MNNQAKLAGIFSSIGSIAAATTNVLLTGNFKQAAAASVIGGLVAGAASIASYAAGRLDARDNSKSTPRCLPHYSPPETIIRR